MRTDMGNLIQRYLRHLSNSVSDSTKDSYRHDLEAFRDYLDQNELDVLKIDLQHLENYSEYLQKVKKYAEATQSRRLQLVKYFFKYLHEGAKLIPENPSTTLKLPKLPERDPVTLSISQAKKMLNIIEKEKNNFLRLRDKAIVLTFLNSGLRVGELANIKLSDVDFFCKNNYFFVIGKGNKERKVVFSKDTMVAIKEYMLIRPKVNSDYLFLSTRKQKISVSTIQYMVYKYLEKAGFKGYSVHKLRSTSATIMSEQGVQIHDIQEVLGHKDTKTTKRYVATTLTTKKQIADIMNGVFTT